MRKKRRHRQQNKKNKSITRVSAAIRNNPSNLSQANASLFSTNHVTQSVFSSGPLPPPEQLKEYDEVLSGSAERIVKLAEEQSAHRRKMEQSSLDAQVKIISRGQYLAFTITLVFGIGGGILLWSGRDIGGIATLVAAIMPAILAFLNKENKKESDGYKLEAE